MFSTAYHGSVAQYIEGGKEPELGDMLEFKRSCLYSHWAIYAGNGKVIHRTGDGDGISNISGAGSRVVATPCGQLLNKAKVQMDHIRNVIVQGVKAKINNYMGKSKWSGYEIVRRAREKIGEIGYNVIYKNCEHFCTEMRYGEDHSKQVQDTAAGVAIAGASILGGIALAKVLGNKDK
ncbi:unnamed protein product [Owenia fusiformis]|uniref:Uncharacterized protein n=1 Tax=Owenia fusiformis TaxID=6347 RepID=A0A8J1YC69_OWEFU|nr:unnamed protein product [Owenia fusiformis]